MRTDREILRAIFMPTRTGTGMWCIRIRIITIRTRTELEPGAALAEIQSTMSIATKTGDKGSTALMYGRRAPKTAARVDAYGTCDELNAALGLVRAHCELPGIAGTIYEVQKELVTLMGELAVSPEDRERYASDGFQFVDAAMVDRLTALIDDLEQNHRITFKHWATPGATPLSAFLDQARVVCRRSERRVAALAESGDEVNPEVLRYLNRLSDLCWLWARYVETQHEKTHANR
jgi:cob(I)alamin adenosyltransferase